MEGARVVAISELLQIGRPLTGASSLSLRQNERRASAIFLAPSHKQKGEGAPLLGDGEPVAPLHAFRPLNIPAVLVGTLGLTGDDGSSRICSSGNHCFCFSDGSGRVCCAVLDLDMAIVGREIYVLAWNFVPISRDGGVLEVIKWSLPDQASKPGNDARPSVPLHFPRREDRSRVRSCAWGVLAAVSPVFSVPFSVQHGGFQGNARDETGDGAYLEGFIVELSTCKCDSCGKARSVKELHHCLLDQKVHSFDNPVFVYFREPCSSWRPILSKLLGDVVTVSGLKKKYISAGGLESLIFVTTERTIVHENGKPGDCGSAERSALPRKGSHVGNYCGVVTGVFKNGTVVELDRKNVWLLLAGPLLDLPHSLRVGAVITVKNVLFIRPSFPWIQILLLGSFIKTSIEVKSFSLIDSRCHSMRQRQSLLWDFIYSLPFYARFWALLVTSSFQKKFAGVLSEKEILGTKKKEGLVENYCKLSLPSSTVEHQIGAFEDFCNHDHSSFGNNSNDVPLMMVVPLSNFIGKCITIWMSTLLKMQADSEIRRENGYASHVFCEEKYHHRMTRKIMSSEELGLVLVGFLQVSPSSGRLQLVDSTGCVDVVMPDLSPNFDPRILYEVKEYTLVLDGFPLQLDPVLLRQSDPLSCRSIFQHFQVKEGTHNVMIYAHFNARNLRRLNTSIFHSVVTVDDAMGSIDADFYLLLVTHKLPHIPNFPDHSKHLNRTSAFAEAVLLPYNLIIKQKHQDFQHAEDSMQPRTTDDIPCLITFTNSTREGYLVPSNSSRKEKISSSNGKQDLQTILLEFKPESINLYQLLCIGQYYILKSSKDLRYRTEHIMSVDSAKALISSQSHLWSLDLSVGQLLLAHTARCDQLSERSSIENYGSHSSGVCESGRLFHHYADMIDKRLDAHLYLSKKENRLLNEIKLLENFLIKAHNMLGEVYSVCSLIEITSSISLPYSGISSPQGKFPEGKFPEGKLISLRGSITDVHISQPRDSDSRMAWSYKGLGDRTLCIHVCEGHHMVKVRGAFCKNVHPFGLGPGANVTFHRVLMLLNSGQYELVMIPVSCLVVNYVERLDHILHCCRNFPPLIRSSESSSDLDARIESSRMGSSRLISELIHYSDKTKVRLHCRVYGTFLLLLEDQVPKPKRLRPAQRFRIPAVRIPLAGFIIDDGSSLCCCWADSGRAKTMLQLEESACQSFSSGHGDNQTQVTVGYLLKKMLKNHRRITLRNFGAKVDSPLVDATFSVDSRKVLSPFDQDALKFVILHAQNGPNLNVAGHVLNLEELPCLEEDLSATDLVKKSMIHVWATEVTHASPLVEARNLMNELLEVVGMPEKPRTLKKKVQVRAFSV
ncbi:unnamed protein product [Spirodela intermedia]|uniref:CST complex subunit CTC1 n=1 Tax=Spirodela intermedia TaxID=51605 RepID=A0A7I8KGQ6_SPIIN|nr:unnamed protein product [Spirodela intermedia]